MRGSNIMKIIYIDKGRFPTEKAHGYQITKMCEVFASLGCEVELWVPDRTNFIKDGIFEYYGLRKNFKVEKIAVIDFFDYLNTLHSLSFYLVSLNYFIKLVFSKLEKDATVYSRSPEIIWLFSLRGFKTVFEAHNWPGRKSSLHAFFLRNASKIVVLTKRIRELFLANNFSEEKILISPDGVDLEVFDISLAQNEARELLGLPSDKKILGYTGSYTTMGEDKGIKDIIGALLETLKKRKDVLFLAVGGSEKDIEFYANIANKYKVFEFIKFIPKVSISELAKYQKACDIMLMPFPDIPHYRHYMSPLKMFEYMASKRPIIASDLPSVRDVLNEKNCVFCNPDDSQDLAEKILYLLDYPEIADTVSKLAFEDVQKYTWQKRADGILKFIG
jgi:glycosyltransferase involved in cell wall biosynthesis